MTVQRFYLALDLKDDPKLIKEYEKYHEKIWPEIEKSIKDSGIISMEIYRTGNRLFMVIVADENFSFEKKSQADASNPKVQEWEKLMWKFQKPMPWTNPGEKWILMNKIFDLH